MRRFTFIAIAAVCVLIATSVLVAQSPQLTPFRGLIDHVSADQWGGASDPAEVWHRAISGDGRYVVMTSPGSYLATDDYNDYNGYDDVFLRDRVTGTTTRISKSQDGGPGDGISQMGTISTNGRHVAFASGSSNLVSGDTNDHWDVFVRDLDQQQTQRISVATDGTQGDRDSYYPSISADGRFVAFLSWASTFATGVPPDAQYNQVYLHDRDADANGVFDEPGTVTTELISMGLPDGIADRSSYNPRVTSDGRHVLFESEATNLSDVGNVNGSNHLYLRDRLTGETALIDRAVTGGPSGWGVTYGTSDMTDDGRFITFSTFSPDIVWFDMNWQSQVLLYDTVAGPTATTIVSSLPDGTVGDGSSYASSLSADGRFVLFTTAASNLASPPPGASGPAMLAVRDMVEGTFTRVDVLDSGEAFDQADYYYTPAISADGTAIVLQSRSTYALGGWYGWGASHAFVVTALSASPASASYPIEGGTGSIEVNTSTVSGWTAESPDPWIWLMDGGGFGAGPRTVQYFVSANNGGITRDGSIRIGSKVIPIHQEGDGDATPPIITPTVTGTQVDGWYTSDVTVTWSVTDPESEIVSQLGCSSVTFTNDFLSAQPFCEATSHGGSASVRLNLRRDTTGPPITITTPTSTTYAPGSIVMPSFTCNDPYSGTATCTISEGSSPLDTTPGWHTFTVSATDNVGNSSTKSVEYLVGTGVCLTPNDSLSAWFRFEDDLLDALERMSGVQRPLDQTIVFAEGVAGRSWQAQPQTSSYLEAWGDGQLLVPGWQGGLTVAAWLRPTGALGESATIVSKPALYRIARYPDGTLRWAFSHTTGYNWINTGVVIPSNAWSHVAVAYDAGLVKTYVNGRLVHTHQLAGTLTPTGDYNAFMTIGGRADATASYWGWIDELQVYTTALGAADVDALARAGNGSTCLPTHTTLTVSVPPTVGFGPTYPVTATLRDSDGNPIADRWVALHSYVSPTGAYVGTNSWTTDVNGQVILDVPMASSVTPGTYAQGLHSYFDGDAHYTPSWAVSDITVVRGTPAISWPSPAAITYGTALGAAQLNATANTAGTFTYSQPAGTVLNAGTQTLSVTFTPSDPSRWNSATVTTTLVVNKATPVMTLSGGPFTYDKQPHAAVATATGALGEALSPVAITYSGSATPPVGAGLYSTLAQYAGSANYTSAFKTMQLRINKAVPTVTITGGPFTYDAQSHPAIAVVRGINENLSPFGVMYDGGFTVPVQAGTHTVTVQYNGNSNYEPITGNGSLIINKATPIVTPNVVSNVTVTYDGQPHGLGLIPSVQGVNFGSLGPVVVTYDGSTVRPTNAGQYAIEVRYDGSTNYNPISRTATLTILQAAPSLTWPAPASITYGTALGGTQLNATSSVPGSFDYSPAAGVVLNAGSHTLTGTFTPTDTTNYQAASATKTLTVLKANPQLAWTTPADIVYGTALNAAQLNAAANVAGTFSYSPAAGAVLNAGSQTLSVSFTPDDAGNYNGASANVSLTVNKAASTINWSNPADIVYGAALGASQLNATANVAGTFSYSPASGAVLNAGSHTLSVTFTPDDAANYNGASANVSLTVSKAASTINWSNPADIVYGAALGGSQLNAAANVPGTFAYSPLAGTVLGAGAHTLSVSFTPDDAANYNGASANVSLTVNKAASTISWSNPADIVYGAALGGSQLNATANVPGSFAYSPLAGTVLGAGSHTLSVTFTPDDAANYDGASSNVSLTVNKAASTISWSNPADIVYGAALGGSQLNATANVAGTFSYSPAAGSGLGAGAHTLSVTFTPDDAANYNGASANVSLTVTKAASTISWSNPADIAYGAALGASQLNATANVAGTFSYSPSTGAVLNAGSHTLSVTFTPDDAANYNGGSANASLTINKAASTISWSNPADIVYGAALGASQLNATANVAGTLSYSPATGAVLSAGSHTLSVTFTAADAANYNGASSNVTLTVTKAASTINWSNPASIVYGTALGASQLNATANVAGTFSYSPAAGSVLGAGTHTLAVTFTPADAVNYDGSSASRPLTVTSAPLTITANGATKVYGEALPAFTASVAGFVNGDSMSSLAGTLTFTTSATATSAPGSYSVTPSGASSANYSITFAAGTLTVTKAGTSLTLTTTPNPSQNNQTVQIRAEVAAVAPGGGTATGTVSFYQNGTLLGSATLVNGVATMNKNFKKGTHPLTATYAGSTNFTGSSGAVTHSTP